MDKQTLTAHLPVTRTLTLAYASSTVTALLAAIASIAGLLYSTHLYPTEEMLLLKVRDVLYDGSWQELRADLQARLEGKPYIFKLASRIEEDLERLEELQAYEDAHGVKLPSSPAAARGAKPEERS